MLGSDPDVAIRLAAFRELERLTAIHGASLAWSEISPGFVFRDQSMLFANRARGIFRPVGMRGGALSIKTNVPRAGRTARYDDREGGAGEFRYRMQGEDPDRFDNQWLRLAYELQSPLIYFVGIKDAVYRPLWPVFITGFHPEELLVTVQLDDETSALMNDLPFAADSVGERARREYATVLAKRRLHQAAFRENILDAYSQRCAICRMPRRELLDAAHIVPDTEASGGEPVVPNGLSLCKLHHGAYDADLLGIRSDGVIVLADRLLKTRDGPTLEHGLKGFRGQSIHRPRSRDDWPDRERLEWRYTRFEISAKSA